MLVPEALQPLRKAFSQLNETAYHDRLLQANFVLSKVPASPAIFARYVKGETPSSATGRRLWYKLVRYYLINLASWGLLATCMLIHRLGGRKDAQPDRPCIILDSYLLVPKTVAAKRYDDVYFPGLAEVASRTCPIIFLPRLYGSRNPWSMLKALRIAEKTIPVISEFSLLTLADLISLLVEALRMPFSVLQLCSSLSSSREDRTISALLTDALDSGYITTLVRRRVGRRLGTLLPAGSRTISWHENQAVDKCFYAGLHETAPHVVRYGAQLLIWPETLLNAHPDDAEQHIGITPDITVVSGPYFLPAKTTLEYRTGPSLRYAHLFSGPFPAHTPGGHVLVLLSYLHEDIHMVLSTLQSLQNTSISLVFRFHPATRTKEYQDMLPESPQFSKGTLKDALDGASLVLGSGTGTLAEAVAMGIPAIVITDPKRFCHNYLPAFGKGRLWDSCANPDELEQAMEHLSLSAPEDERRELQRAFRDLLFTRPTELSIIEAFDL